MRYHNITHDDMLNGQGLRTVLWVAGCEHRCNGCQNPITWDLEGGLPFDEEAEKELFSYLNKDYIHGITFSGGDPLHPQNRNEITRLAKIAKEKYPEKTVWLYSGYEWDEVKDLEVMKYTDIFIDGKFVEELKDNNLHWKGSSNQKTIDVQKSLSTKKTVLYED
ncbi:MAG: anaerobic ribonucleoside-triphosphate reductase activating protein [Firmicutes bacterium]|nr:anaerobic ribonucleoside-triphosphate reductase activating protein [Bacillota bacterium]